MSTDEELRLIATYGMCRRCGGPRWPVTLRWTDEHGNPQVERSLTCACETDGGVRHWLVAR